VAAPLTCGYDLEETDSGRSVADRLLRDPLKDGWRECGGIVVLPEVEVVTSWRGVTPVVRSRLYKNVC